jgi:hypothetical protein
MGSELSEKRVTLSWQSARVPEAKMKELEAELQAVFGQ